MLYLVNDEASIVSYHIDFPSGVVFISELWVSSSHRKTVDRFGQLVFVDMVVWASVD